MEIRAPEKRELAVDAARTLAVLMVLGIHLGGGVPMRPAGIGWLDSAWAVFRDSGSYGVMAFFVVSGYLITQMIERRNGQLLRPGLRDFYVGRAARLLPLFIVIVALGAAALGVPALRNFPGFAFCFRNPTADFDAGFWLSLPTFSFNWLRIAREGKSFGFGLHWDLLWSLSVEEQFYLFYPLLLWRARNREAVVKILWCLVALGPVARAVCYFIAPVSYLWGYTNSFVCVDLLALGALAHLYAHKHREAWRARPARSIALAVAGFALWLGTYFQIVAHPVADHLVGASLVGVGVALFLFGGRHAQGWAAERWNRAGELFAPHFSVLTLPGRLSYGCYLWQTAVLFALLPILGKGTFVWGFLAFIAAVTLVAEASHRLLEGPARRAIESKFLRRGEHPASEPSARNRAA